MKSHSLRFWLANGCVLHALLSSYPTVAQVVPDTTLPANSIVTPQGNTSIISGGTKAGINLFHSFGSFSISTGSTAYFNNALDIQNIFSRVTGGSISNIDGLIRANGAANLFLINPNGMIFGPNARLNIGGSFLASTANSINFADGFGFSATSPQTTLLTISVPVGLQYGGNAGGIQVRGSSIQVPANQTLALVGGNVQLDGASLLTPGSHVELGGLASRGTVGLNMNGNGLRLSFPDDVGTDVSLTNGAEVNVGAGDSGSIAVNSQNLQLAGGSRLRAGIALGLGSPGSQAGDIDIKATGAIALTGGSFIANTVAPRAVGNGGDINIVAGSLALTNGAVLSTNTFGQGKAGNVNITAQSTLSFDGVSSNTNSGVYSQVISGAIGNGGDINIVAGSLALTNGAVLSTSTRGRGKAGNVTVTAHGAVSFDGVGSNGYSSGVYSQVVSGAVGNGGDINIVAGSLALTNGAELSPSTFGQGKAGNVNITAQSTLSFDGVSRNKNSGVYSQVAPGAIGNGGDINIVAGSLALTNGAVLSTSTFGRGASGNVTVTAHGPVSFDGVGSNGYSSGAYSLVELGAVGNGGDINIVADSLSVTNGSGLSASLRGQGKAGNITVTARDTVSIDGVGSPGSSSGLFTTTRESSLAQGGDITVRTGVLRLSNGGVLSARSGSVFGSGQIFVNADTLELTGGGQILTTAYGSGRAGDITVNATSGTTISGSDPTFLMRLARYGRPRVDPASPASGLFANNETNSSGQGGSIRITTGQLQVLNGGQVAVDNLGTGNAGNIEVMTRALKLERGQLTSATASGTGGNIQLQVQDLLLLRDNSGITAAAGGNGNGGNISINTPLLVAIPNEDSDISANSVGSRGGDVIINTSGIFGIQFRPQDTPLSDITATGKNSALNGTVIINTPGIDPSRGLVALPTTPVDPTRLIAQGCRAAAGNSFTVTGRGGLPSTPQQPLGDDPGWRDWRTPDIANEQPSVRPERSLPLASDRASTKSAASTSLVEATGWAIGPQGEVILTATAPSVATQNWNQPANCHGQ